MTTDPTARRKLAPAALGTALHAGLLLALLALYVAYVPAVKRTFDEYGILLPWTTLAVIRLSNWLSEYWWTLAPVFGLLGLADFALIRAWHRTGGRAATVWVLAVALALCFACGATAISVAVPLAKLREGLAR